MDLPIETIAHRRFKAAYNYNQKINYYNRISENENYINGFQWGDTVKGNVPTPVFNIEKRIMDYKIAALSSQKVKAVYGIEGVTQYGEITDEMRQDESVMAEVELGEMARLLSGNAEVRWEKLKMDSMLRRFLRDGFVTGDMCAHTYWDDTIKTGQKAKGDFVTERVHSGNVFFGNPNEPDPQKQPWIILLVRDTVENLRAEAERYGVPKSERDKIVSDKNTETQVGKYGQIEIDGDDSTGKCNAYIMYYKKDGVVHWSKSTQYVTIRKDVNAKISLYPIAWANWNEVENCYHGNAECTVIHPNQRFINKMFSICMLWFMNNSFGKVAFDATRISGWTNDVATAIPVQGTVDGVIQQLSAGNFNAAVLMVIDYAIKYTKEMQGVTDAALGQERADNTSALIVAQKASALPLENQQARMYQFIEDIFLIWAEFMVNYYVVGRKIPMKDQDGNVVYKEFTAKDKDKLVMNVKIEVGASSFWSEESNIENLTNLLRDGHITFIQFLERLPNGRIEKKQQLIDELKAIAMSAQDPNNPVPTEPDNSQFEAEAQFFDSLPFEIRQQLQALPPEQMEAEIQRMMTGAPIQ